MFSSTSKPRTSQTLQIGMTASTTTVTTTSDDSSPGWEALPGSDLSDSLRPQNAHIPPYYLPENEPWEMSEIRQPSQDKNYIVLKDAYHQLHRDMKSVCSDLEIHKRELRRTQEELRNARDALNELRDEDRGKDIFGLTSKADKLSISEVGEKVTALNEEIFQAAATLGEALIYRPPGLSQEELDAAIADSRRMVGEMITNLLVSQSQKPEPEVNPLLVQVVLQIIIVKFCFSKIQSWYPNDSTIGESLKAIYSTIRSSEEQAVSGRWRVLTRAHTASTETEKAWGIELSQKIRAVLKIAAWIPRCRDDVVPFTNRLSTLYKAVNELRLAIDENFTSADLDVSVFEPGTRYEPSYMEDAYDDGRPANESIVGTTGIGLKKVLRERDANNLMLFEHVTSAKIVLESTLKEALKSSRLAKGKSIENTNGADR